LPRSHELLYSTAAAWLNQSLCHAHLQSHVNEATVATSFGMTPHTLTMLPFILQNSHVVSLVIHLRQSLSIQVQILDQQHDAQSCFLSFMKSKRRLTRRTVSHETSANGSSHSAAPAGTVQQTSLITQLCSKCRFECAYRSLSGTVPASACGVGYPRQLASQQACYPYPLSGMIRLHRSCSLIFSSQGLSK